MIVASVEVKIIVVADNANSGKRISVGFDHGG